MRGSARSRHSKRCTSSQPRSRGNWSSSGMRSRNCRAAPPTDVAGLRGPPPRPTAASRQAGAARLHRGGSRLRTGIRAAGHRRNPADPTLPLLVIVPQAEALRRSCSCRSAPSASSPRSAGATLAGCVPVPAVRRPNGTIRCRPHLAPPEQLGAWCPAAARAVIPRDVDAAVSDIDRIRPDLSAQADMQLRADTSSTVAASSVAARPGAQRPRPGLTASRHLKPGQSLIPSRKLRCAI